MKAIRDNVILKMTLKQKIGGIILSTDKDKPELYIDKIEVHSVGKDVKSVKKGNEVLINEPTLAAHNRLKAYKTKEKEGIVYIGAREDDIIGIY